MGFANTRHDILELIVTLALDELYVKNSHYASARPRDISSAKRALSITADAHCQYILLLITDIHGYEYGDVDPASASIKHARHFVKKILLRVALSTRSALSATQLADIVDAFRKYRVRTNATIFDWPLLMLVSFVAKALKDKPTPPEVSKTLWALKRDIIDLNMLDPTGKGFTVQWQREHAQKIIDVIDELVLNSR